MHPLINIILSFTQFLILQTGGQNRMIRIDNLERKYIFYKPAMPSTQKKYPVVFNFHGGGGKASYAEKESGFNELADVKGFIVVYPEGINKGWNDGRAGGKLNHDADDVKFISLLIDKLVKEENADPQRIFVTGISNGGFFSIYLAYKLSYKIKAVAPVCANIPENLKDSFSLPNPISLLLINGTSDPLVKYEGGPILSQKAGRGRSISTDATIKKWLVADKIITRPAIEKISDTNKSDGCDAIKYTYSGGSNNTSVILIKINNGGHTWPGGRQYLPRFIVGNMCKDFSATEMIWDFFSKEL